jgi:hypothetical protein
MTGPVSTRLDARAPATRLAAFRLLAGGFAVVYLLVRLPYWLDVIRLDDARWHPLGVLAPLDGPPAAALARMVLAATVLAGVAFVAGWRYRITGPAFAVLLLGTLTYRNSWGHLFHTDQLLALHVLVLGFVPAADRWSLDARRAARADRCVGRPVDDTADVRYGWPLRLAGIVTVATYVVTGAAKVRYAGGDWLGGDTLLHQVAFDNARKIVLGAPSAPLAELFVAHPLLFRPLGALTLLVELGAPIALLGRRWATGWTAIAWAFHVGILAIMAIGFPYPLTLVAFAPLLECERPFEWVGGRVAGRRGRRGQAAAATASR